MMTFSFVLGVFFMLSGSMGIPMGMPPGPEDPMMARLAPEECLIYSSWSGVAEIDGDANPTEKWLAQPKASKMIAKLRKAYRGYLLQQAEQSGDVVLQLSSKLIVEAVDAASVQPAAFYLDEIGVDQSVVKAHGAFVIKLGQREEAVVGLFDELCKELESQSDDASHHALEVAELDDGIEPADRGQRALKIFTGSVDMQLHIVVRDGYLIIAIGKDALSQVNKNMATAAPAWLTQLRTRLSIDRIASVAYVNSKVLKELEKGDGASGLTWWSEMGWNKGLESVGWVAGVDQYGFLCRGELIEDDLEQNDLLGLIEGEPIPDRFLRDLPVDKTLAVATRLSSKKILELVRGSMSGEQQKEMLEESLAKFQKLSGVSLEKELLSSLGDYISVYYDFELHGLAFANRGWVASIAIEDEMSFPEYMFQINEGVKNWAEDAPDAEFQTSKFGQYEIKYLETGKSKPIFAWAVVDDHWYFAGIPEDIVKHLKRDTKRSEKGDKEKALAVAADAGKANQRNYLDDATVKEILAFGDRSGFENPVVISHLDFPGVIRTLKPFIAATLESDEPFRRGWDFKWNDIPPVAELTNEVTPNFMAIFKTDKGFQLYQRQTYPGAPPIVTVAAAGIVSFSLQMGTVTTKKRMHEIGKAHLAFEKKHGSLCSTYSTGPQGEPLLSWRVHLLPFLGHQDLYDKFRLNEAWDSEHNKLLLAEMPLIYGHSELELSSWKTAFLAPSAEGTLFNRVPVNVQQSPLGIGAADIKDPRFKTLMLMEVNKEHAVTWTQPLDFHEDEDQVRQWTRRTGGRKAVFLMGDGSLRTLTPYWPKKSYRKILRHSDGGKIEFPQTNVFDWDG